MLKLSQQKKMNHPWRELSHVSVVLDKIEMLFIMPSQVALPGRYHAWVCVLESSGKKINCIEICIKKLNCNWMSQSS